MGAAESSSKLARGIHEFTVKDARGNDVELSRYKGKVVLIVNVASRCGLTNSNYNELGQLHEKYKDEGLEILAFPCNQFAGQEPGSNEQVDVNGSNAAPLYKFMKSERGGLFGERIKWNFTKFLVDKEGHVVNRYAPTSSPLNIENDIKNLLGA
ncbi:probable phospholipid hydroperoxide glutathione peroxidase isoform X3 [Oryza brachyantha]|uniref:probable phospholipid hydroperoxide glutathione peroxidase isoform X3 n=1 Tax=Oryza brachyantha TaxID=4533 RepID=UPI0003EAC124|nr:probable phospholipid hydroperoxide glutathione peroxidase isoform X3 [Oryza brachyantha]